MKENLNTVKDTSGVMNDKRFYTYAYLREDRTPYYIGKGKHKHKTNQKYYRAYCGNHWVPIPPKHRIIILKDDIYENDAFKHEIYMISIFGRKDLNTGILLNLTNGGEGFSGFKLTEERKRDISKRMKEYVINNGNPNLKKYLLINVSGEYYVVDDGLAPFCKEKNIPFEGMTRRKNRGFDTPTKCGWYYFNITDKNEYETNFIKNNFLAKYQNRFADGVENLYIPSNIQVANKSINLVFNFIKEKIETENNITLYNNKKYIKISKIEFEKIGVSVGTAFKAIKVLKENNIIEVEKLNKSNFDNINYYSLMTFNRQNHNLGV